jgi:hypothetical protein
MASMMVMGLKLGLEGAVIAAIIGRGFDMVSGCIGSILGMFTLENGRMGRVMGVECTLVRMGVGMLESSSGVSSMVLAITISGELNYWLVL